MLLPAIVINTVAKAPRLSNAQKSTGGDWFVNQKLCYLLISELHDSAHIIAIQLLIEIIFAVGLPGNADVRFRILGFGERRATNETSRGAITEPSPSAFA